MSLERLCKGPCGRTLPATEEYFYFRVSSRNGKAYASTYCRECESAKSAKSRRERYATPEGKEAIDSQTAAYRAKPEKAQAISDHLKDRYENDLEYRQARKDASMAWKAANPVRNAENKSAWTRRSRVILNMRRRTRLAEDPEFRLRNNFRVAVWAALRYWGGDKGGRSILKYLPYTMAELRAYIESLWEPWMNWENWGPLERGRRTWQIDHVVPQVKLPFKDFDDPNFLKCWSLSNLRPICAAQNVSKGCR